MTGRTRYFLLSSVLVIVVGLCTGLVAFYNGGLSLSKSAAGPSELTYLPADASVVAYANVGEVMKSDVRKRIQQALPTGEDKEKLQAETGIDLERDIDSVVAGFTAGEPALNGVVVVVRGRFDAAKIEALAVQHGGVVETYNGKRLVLSDELPKTHTGITSTGDAAHNLVAKTTGGLAFLDSGVLALGDSASIKRAIDAHASGENITKNDDLMKLVGDLKNGNNAWLVGRFDAVSKTVGLPDIAKEKLATVQWFAVSAHVDGGVSGVVRAETVDDKSAEDLRAVVNGGLAAARLFGGQNQSIETAVNSLQMSGTGKTVSLSFSVSPEMLDILSGVAGLSKLGTSPKMPPKIK